MSAFTHNRKHTVTEWPLLWYLILNEPLSFRGLSVHGVIQDQIETRSADSSELCEEVWSQCQFKSYLLDTDRKEAMRMCVLALCWVRTVCTVRIIWATACSATLFYLSYFTSTCLSATWQSHIKSLIQQHVTWYKQERTRQTNHQPVAANICCLHPKPSILRQGGGAATDSQTCILYTHTCRFF